MSRSNDMPGWSMSDYDDAMEEMGMDVPERCKRDYEGNVIEIESDD